MSEDPGRLWRSQPEERLHIDVQQFVNRRAGELESATRGDILAGIGGALFLAAVVAWRFAPSLNRAQLAGVVRVFGWALITAYAFRGKIFRRNKPERELVAATCLDYYRRQLAMRRDHLRNAWIWLGPLTLACLLLTATLMSKAMTTDRRLFNVAPFLAVLAIWVAWGISRRRAEANALQREIDEMN